MKKNRVFLTLLISALAFVVCVGHAAIKDLKSDNKGSKIFNICQVMLHVSDKKVSRKVDFIFFPSSSLIRSIEANEPIESEVLDLVEMPMYDNFKKLGITNKCWSHVKVESQNDYIYFTFLEEKDDHNKTISSELVDSCIHGIELKEGSTSYGISLNSIKKTNNKIRFFFKKTLLQNVEFSRSEDKTEQHRFQQLKYKQTQSRQAWLFEKYSENVNWCQVHGMSYLKYKVMEVAPGLIMVPLHCIIAAGVLCKKSISNISMYVLFFGSYFACAVLGASGNESKPVEDESLTLIREPIGWSTEKAQFKEWSTTTLSTTLSTTLFASLVSSIPINSILIITASSVILIAGGVCLCCICFRYLHHDSKGVRILKEISEQYKPICESNTVNITL